MLTKMGRTVLGLSDMNFRSSRQGPLSPLPAGPGHGRDSRNLRPRLGVCEIKELNRKEVIRARNSEQKQKNSGAAIGIAVIASSCDAAANAGSVAVCVVLSLDLLRRCLVFQRSRMVLAAAVVVASEGFQRCGIGHGRRCGVGRGRWFMVKAMEGMVQAV
nr:hypothetical protein Iba_chr15bCG11270 [Ipomoea batatas]